MIKFSQFWKVSLYVRLKTNLFEVQTYLYLLVEKIMFKSHVNLFSYIIITILKLQSGTVWKVNMNGSKRNIHIKWQIISIGKTEIYHNQSIRKVQAKILSKHQNAWELYDVVSNFQCVQDLVFLHIINSKQSVLSNWHNML